MNIFPNKQQGIIGSQTQQQGKQKNKPTAVGKPLRRRLNPEKDLESYPLYQAQLVLMDASYAGSDCIYPEYK